MKTWVQSFAALGITARLALVSGLLYRSIVRKTRIIRLCYCVVSIWIDYWAVDWDNRDDTFHNMWQTYRTRKDKSLALEAAHSYDAPGEYRIMVKVIDILGNDTTKTIQITIP